MDLHDFKAVDLDDDKILIDRTIQGAWKISTIHKGQLITKQYFFYSKKEALNLFKAELA